MINVFDIHLLRLTNMVNLIEIRIKEPHRGIWKERVIFNRAPRIQTIKI